MIVNIMNKWINHKYINCVKHGKMKVNIYVRHVKRYLAIYNTVHILYTRATQNMLNQ